MNRARTILKLVLFATLAGSATGCYSEYTVRPVNCASVWVPGHRGPWGGWRPGHWRCV